MFVFRFEKLLNIKSKLLDDKRMKIAALEKKIVDLERDKSNLENENKKRRAKIFKLLSSNKPDRNMIIFFGELIEKCEAEIHAIENKILMLSEEKNKLMNEARELLKEKKKLEKLKEKQFEEYRVNLSRTEMRFLDDIASIKAANRIVNNG